MKEKSFKIVYDIHCRFENHFKKEIIVKRCLSEIHAKIKLREYIQKKYGPEFDYIIVISCKEDVLLGDTLDSILNDSNNPNYFSDFLKKMKNKDFKGF